MSINVLLECKKDKETLLAKLLEKLSQPDSISSIFRADIPSTWLKELAIELARELSHESINR